VTASDVRFVVRLTPRGGADRVDGVGEDGLLRVRVAAPPVDDAANQALVRLIARELGLSRTAVRIVSGATARRKTVAVDGLDRVAILARWPGLGL
jgi:uncharacterized protein YggU (UPF0235/DUF167 family)